jgi:serine O-acetyltransferase
MGNAVEYLQPISPEIPDWTREEPSQFWDPGRKLLRTIRRYQYWQRWPRLISRFFCKLLVLRRRFWSVVRGADIPLNCRIGGGLLIPHTNGIVIHPDAVIGVNCLIFQQVTIGCRTGTEVPVIAGHVDIGAGTKILGNVRIWRPRQDRRECCRDKKRGDANNWCRRKLGYPPGHPRSPYN